MRHFFILLSTGGPGLQRLIVFLAIERLYGAQILGQFTINYSYVQLLSYFTAIGWSGLILTRIPKIESDCDRRTYLSSVLNVSFLYFVIFSSILYFIMLDQEGAEYLYSLSFLASWMVYQIFRHYYISLSAHERIVLADMVSVFSLLAAMSLHLHPLLSLTIGFSISSIILAYGKLRFTTKLLSLNDQGLSLSISLSNFLSGLPFYALPIVLGFVSGTSTAAIVGYVMAFIAILDLVPRALAFYFLPKISANINNSLALTYTRRQIYINSGFSLLSLIFVFTILEIIKMLDPEGILGTDGAEMIYILLLLATFIATLSLPFNNYLLALEKTKTILCISLSSTFLTMLAFIIYIYDSSLEKLLISMCIISFMKIALSFLMYRSHARSIRQGVVIDIH